jgi:uncharacterized membrane protein YhhN
MRPLTFLNVPALQITYFLLLALVVESKALDLKWLEYATKPLLMPVLALLVLAALRPPRDDVWRLLLPVLVALAFATVGDVCLMFERGFMMGLGAFFVTQCIYAYMLWPARSETLLKPEMALIATGLAGNFFVQYSLVRGSLGSARIPALVYFALFSMVVFLAAARYLESTTAGVARLLVGIALFYVSDLLIALSTFHRTFRFSGEAVMLTYGLGQYLFLTSYLAAPSE